MTHELMSSKKQSRYLEIYRRLREEIVSDVYPFGTKLPSKRVLAARYGVSVTTVEHALAILCDEGYAVSKERSGVFAAYRAGDSFAVAPTRSVKEPPHVQTHVGETLPLTVLSRTVRRVIAEYGAELFAKSPNNGAAILRHAICAYLARGRGIRVQPEQVVIGSGAEYLYSLVVQMLGRDRVFAVEDPCYEKIREVYRANGVTIEPLAMGAEGIQTEALAKSSASVLHVTPYHSFPSGVTATASKRHEYIEFARKKAGFLIEDDFDSEFTASAKVEDTLFSLDDTRVIYMNTFTRTVAPGLRVGYAVLPRELLPLFRTHVGFYSCTVPTLEQYVLAELLNSGDFERHVNRMRRRKRKMLVK